MATADLAPNGDDTTNLSATGSPHYGEIDEVGESTSDYVYQDGDATNYDIYDMETQSGIDSVSQLSIEVLVRSESSSEPGTVACKYSVNGGASWSSLKSSSPSDSWVWKTFTWTGLSLSQSDVDDLLVYLELTGGSSCYWDYWIRCATLDAEITYTEAGWSEGSVNSVDATASNVGKVNSVEVNNIGKINSV